MNKISKEEYLKLLDAVIKDQQIDDLEVNKEYLEDEPIKKPLRFNYVESQGFIDATNMTREEIDFAWKNQGNIKVGDFLLKVSTFAGDADHPYIYFNLYDYERDEKGKIISTKIDVKNDIRFSSVTWQEYCEKPSNFFKVGLIKAPLTVTLDAIEWLQKLDRVGAFI